MKTANHLPFKNPTRRNIRYWVIVWHTIFGGLVVLAGCGESSTASITGQVTLDGKALATGDIELIPERDTGGPTVGGSVMEGRFDIPAIRGPKRGGKYRIEIRSLDANSGSTSHHLSRGKAVYSDRIPSIYNSESKLSVAVPLDVSSIQQDFDLQSKAK